MRTVDKWTLKVRELKSSLVGRTNAQTSVDLRDAYELGAGELRDLWRLLEKRIGPVQATLGCRDSTELLVDKLEAVLEYRNERPREIVSLELAATVWQPAHKSATLRFVSGLWARTSLRIDGPEDVVVRLRADVVRLLEGMRPWYRWCARVDAYLLVIGSAMCAWIGVMVYFAFAGSNRVPGPQSTRSSLREQLLLIFGVVALVFTGLIAQVLRERIFPRVVIALGQAARRQQNMNYWRVMFLGSVVIPVVLWLLL